MSFVWALLGAFIGTTVGMVAGLIAQDEYRAVRRREARESFRRPGKLPEARGKYSDHRPF